MQHRYYLKGVTCDACKEKITGAWMAIPAVEEVKFIDTGKVDIVMREHISLEKFQDALVALKKYRVSDTPFGLSWLLSGLMVYRWLLFILSLIIIFTIVDVLLRSRGWWDIMMAFMGRWFIVFSALKLYNLSWFVDGFVSYDIVAKRWRAYAWLYPFVELVLGLCFLFGFIPLIASIVTLVIMIVGTIGVWKALGRKIQCVCIGTFFSLPLTKVTVVENLFMAAMAVVMIFLVLG